MNIEGPGVLIKCVREWKGGGPELMVHKVLTK